MSNRPTRVRRAAAVLGAIALAFGAAVFTATPASAAAMYTVNVTTGDASPGSLIWAIQQANGDPGSTVGFSLPAASTITIDAGQSIPDLNADVTIAGPGASQLTIVDTDGTATALESWRCGTSSVTLDISGLTFSGFGGGGIFGCLDLRLSDVVFDDSGALSWSLYVEDSAFRGQDLVVHANGGAPVYFKNTGVNTVGMDVVGLEVDGTVATAGGSIGVSAAGADARVYISDVTVSDSLSRGFDIYSADEADVKVSGATVSGSAGDGLHATVQSDGTFRLAGGTFTDNAGTAVVLDVDGAHAEVTDVDATSSGAAAHGLTVFGFDDSDTTIARVSLHDFTTTGFGAAQLVLVGGSTADVSDSDFLRNSADSGAGLNLGSLDGVGSALTISGSVFASNVATGDGGAIYLSGVGSSTDVGGVTISRTAIVQNEADAGGGIFLAGSTANSEISGAPVVLIDSSQLSENSARVGGGILLSYGNSAAPGPIGILNSTINDNTATEYGGGVYAFGMNDAELDFAYSTIVKNTAGIEGDGVFLAGASKVRILGSILAGDGFDLAVSGGGIALTTDWSLVQEPDPTATLALAAGTGNIVGVDPKLGPLANNGGVTLTMLPLAGSPVIDVIDPASVDVPPMDQRGVTRAGNGKADIGAVELTTLALAATGPAPIGPALGALILLVGGVALVAFRMRVRV